MTLADLLPRMRIDAESGCWIWRGPTLKKLPRFVPHRGKSINVRRLLYEHANGPVDALLYVTYSCDDELCVRPSHTIVLDKTGLMRNAKARGRGVRHDAIWRARLTIGKRTRSRRMSMEIARDIRARSAAGETQVAMAKEYGVSSSSVWCIVHNVLWREQPTTGLAMIARQAGML